MSDLDTKTHLETGREIGKVLYAFDGFCHFHPGWHLDSLSHSPDIDGKPLFTAILKSDGIPDMVYHYLIMVGFNELDLMIELDRHLAFNTRYRLHTLVGVRETTAKQTTYYAILEETFS